MDVEETPFQKITQSLVNLSEVALLSLEKLVWDTQMQMLANEELKQKQFSAEAEFSDQKVGEEILSFETIKTAIAVLNPAELNVLHTLITWHLDKAHRHEGLRATASWASNSGSFLGVQSFETMQGVSSALKTSQLGPRTEAIKAFKEMTDLMEQASAAKKIGDKKRALELIEVAIKLAEQAGIPSYMLQRMRELYL